MAGTGRLCVLVRCVSVCILAYHVFVYTCWPGLRLELSPQPWRLRLCWWTSGSWKDPWGWLKAWEGV